PSIIQHPLEWQVSMYNGAASVTRPRCEILERQFVEDPEASTQIYLLLAIVIGSQTLGEESISPRTSECLQDVMQWKLVHADLIHRTRPSSCRALSEHSQTVRTRQPRERSARRFLSSRSILDANLASQKVRRVAGLVAYLHPRCLCQKQP